MLNKEFFEWIEANRSEDPARLRLKYADKSMPFDIDTAILQIESRRKHSKKLSETLTRFDRFIFPNSLSGEQATSDKLAAHHAEMVTSGSRVADLTAGLGIDAIHISERAASITAVERNRELADGLKYNSAGLNISNLTVVCDDCRNFIKSEIAKTVNSDCKEKPFDVVFIDPARRAADGSRVFALSDCEPDVVEMLSDISKITDTLIVKASPMLDITHTITELSSATPVKVIALGTTTECKELVAVIDFNRCSEHTKIEAVTISDKGTITLSYTESENKSAKSDTQIIENPNVGDFVYEPYPSVMKTGGFNVLSDRFNLSSFHTNTHIFYSSNINTDFPGNIYQIVEVLSYSSRNIKQFKRKYPVIDVAVRNFGTSADSLRIKLGVKAGKSDFRLYGITDCNNEKLLIVTKQIKA